MKQLRKRTRQDSGQATVTIVVVLVAVAAVSFLLLKTMNAAVSINEKASTIKADATVINKSGDSIPALKETNRIADSILVTAAPLAGRGRTIESLATNIDKNATGIDQTAATIVQTALGINAQAVAILNTARSIDAGAKTITGQLVTTVGVARTIKRDTGSIRISATSIHRNACGLLAGLGLVSPNGLGENCGGIRDSGNGHS